MLTNNCSNKSYFVICCKSRGLECTTRFCSILEFPRGFCEYRASYSSPLLPGLTFKMPTKNPLPPKENALFKRILVSGIYRAINRELLFFPTPLQQFCPNLTGHCHADPIFCCKFWSDIVTLKGIFSIRP